MSKKQALSKLLIFLLIIFSVSATLIYLQNQIGLEKIRQFIIDLGPAGPLVYMLIVVLTHIVAPIQGSPFLLLAFAVYGKWTIPLTYGATIVSSFTNFWIARKFGREAVIKFVGLTAMNKIDHFSSHEGPKALAIARFFQGWVTDYISYAAGFTAIKFSTYYIISVLVPIPWTVLMFIFFDQIPQDQMFFWVLVTGLIFFVIPPIYFFTKHKFSGNKISHTP